MVFAKALAIYNKYTAHYKSYTLGLLVGFVISFISYGFLPIIFPGNIDLKIIERLRHGHVFPGENKKEIFKILSRTLLFVLILTSTLHLIYNTTNLIFFKYGYLIGAVIMMFAVLPTPDNIGIFLFYSNKKKYYILAPFYFFLSLFLIIGIKNSILFGFIFLIIIRQLLLNPKINPVER
jgi:hypothetical protein